MLNQVLSWLNLSKKGFIHVLLGSMIMAFTVVQIHIPAQITEGGILGLSLFSYKVLGLNPSIISPILDFLCYALGLSLFGKTFLKRTALASALFALWYRLFLNFDPIFAGIYDYPILAAVVGGIGIGVGCGLVVSQGGAAGGDDALALVISRKAKVGISKAYLLTDVTVLILSLVYIPFARIFFSLLTTTVSSLLVGQFEIQLETPMYENTAEM